VWEDYAFVGWNTQADGGGSAFTAATSVAADITVYAQWVDGRNEFDFGAGASVANTFNVANLTQWDSAVSAISTGGANRNYIINITADFSIPGYSSSNTFGSANGIKVSLRGVGRTLSLSSVNRRLLLIGNTQTVVLRGLALQGIGSGNSRSGVEVVAGGAFTMRSGTISGNRNGGGVHNEGTFTMHGGTISDNRANSYGGGVYNTGTFTMHGGTISGNHAPSNGGGVITWGTFRISNGTIYGSNAAAGLRNTASSGFAALSGNATYGTLSGNTWVSNGTLSNANNTIRVVNGVLQP
jgi:uncharacterized repeat protein (TIGR02543 family)